MGDLLVPIRAAGQLLHFSLEFSPELPPSLLAELKPFSALVSLELDAAQLPAPTAAMLASLTQLTRLCYCVCKVLPQLLEAAQALPLLAQLALEAPRLPPAIGPVLAEMTQLQSLRWISAVGGRWGQRWIGRYTCPAGRLRGSEVARCAMLCYAVQCNARLNAPPRACRPHPPSAAAACRAARCRGGLQTTCLA